MFVLERTLQIQQFVHQKEVALDLTIVNANLVSQVIDAKSAFVMEKNLWTQKFALLTEHALHLILVFVTLVLLDQIVTSTYALEN
jgi:hypothetical protein